MVTSNLGFGVNPLISGAIYDLVEKNFVGEGYSAMMSFQLLIILPCFYFSYRLR
jgi:hypothetical protein